MRHTFNKLSEVDITRIVFIERDEVVPHLLQTEVPEQAALEVSPQSEATMVGFIAWYMKPQGRSGYLRSLFRGNLGR